VVYMFFIIVNFTIMKKLLLFIVFTFFVSVLGFSQNSPIKNSVCDDVFNYEMSENSTSEFNISITKSTMDNFNFKLFSIDRKEKLIDELRSNSSSNSVEFKNLNKDNIYLIQVYGINNDCRFTIGGIEGIKFENR